MISRSHKMHKREVGQRLRRPACTYLRLSFAQGPGKLSEIAMAAATLSPRNVKNPLQRWPWKLQAGAAGRDV
jgi:hypothetical protein